MDDLKHIKKKEAYIYLLALLPLLSLFMVSVAIIVFVVVAFLAYLYREKTKSEKRLPFTVLILFTLPFLMYIVSLIWTENIQVGLKFVEKTASFLVIPVTFFVFEPFKEQNQIKNFTKVFIYSSAISVVLTVAYIFTKINYILNQKNSYTINIRLRESIEQVPVIGEHAIYFSLIMAVALLLLFYNRFQKKWLNIFFCSLFSLGIIVASSKGVIISVMATGALLLFQEIKNKRKAVFYLSLLFVCFGAIAFFSPINDRVNEILKTKYVYPVGVHYNSFNLRVAIYNCAISLFEDTPLIGHAPGDTQQKLNECYKKFNTNAFHEFDYNTHNQYFDYFLSFGIIGVSLILFSFGYFLRIATINKNKQYFNFLTLIYIVFLTENVLVRNTGIVLFATFNCLFAYSTLFGENLNSNLNIKNDSY